MQLIQSLSDSLSLKKNPKLKKNIATVILHLTRFSEVAMNFRCIRCQLMMMDRETKTSIQFKSFYEFSNFYLSSKKITIESFPNTTGHSFEIPSVNFQQNLLSLVDCHLFLSSLETAL